MRSTGKVCGAEIRIGPPKMNTYGTSGLIDLYVETISCTSLFLIIFLWCTFTFSIEHTFEGALPTISLRKFILADSIVLLTLLSLESAYATELLILLRGWCSTLVLLLFLFILICNLLLLIAFIESDSIRSKLLLLIIESLYLLVNLEGLI